MEENKPNITFQTPNQTKLQHLRYISQTISLERAESEKLQTFLLIELGRKKRQIRELKGNSLAFLVLPTLEKELHSLCEQILLAGKEVNRLLEEERKAFSIEAGCTLLVRAEDSLVLRLSGVLGV
jgi:hypothetical protein